MSTLAPYLRTEMFLGPIHGVHVIEAAESEETWTGNAPFAETLDYELNMIDGWVKLTSRADEDGHFAYFPDRVPATVREVLDSVPTLAPWVADVHLRWHRALTEAGDARRGPQRSALTRALRAHGLVLSPAA